MEWTIDQENTLLIGNFEESFYQLGVRDKMHWHQENHKANLPDRIASALFLKNIPISETLSRSIKSYAEGIEIPYVECLTYLINCETKNIKSGLPRSAGSMAILHRQKEKNHFYRFFGHEYCHAAEKAYRSTLFNFTNKLKVAAISDWHYPHPNSFAINEKGLILSYSSLAMNKNDSLHGAIGSDLFQELCFNATSIQEVAKELKKVQLYSNGQIIILDQQGEVLELVWASGNFKTTTHNLNEKSPLIFTPASAIEIDDRQNRSYYFDQTVLANLKNKLTTKMSDSALSKVLLTNDGPFSPINLTTSKIAIIENNDFKITSFPLDYPFIHHKKMFVQSEIWSDFSKYNQVAIDGRKVHADPNPGLGMLQKAQINYNQNKFEEAYHFIQLGIDHLKTEQLAYDASFYFIVWQYLRTTRTTELRHLYLQLQALEPRISDLLKDHYHIISLRLEKALNLRTSRDPDIISDEKLRSQYRSDLRTMNLILEASKKFIRPRLDTFDIEY